MISTRDEDSKQDTERQGAFKPFKKTSSDGPSTSDEVSASGEPNYPLSET